MNDREANRGRGQSNRGRFGFGRRRAGAAAVEQRVAALDSDDEAASDITEEQRGYFDDASDDELVMRLRQAVALQRGALRGSAVPPGVGHDGELAAYALGEMARRGMEDELREVLEVDAGEPASTWVVSFAPTGPDAQQRSFTSATDAVRCAEERRRDPFVREVTVDAFAADSPLPRRLMRSGLGQRLRFVPLPDPNSMTLVERDHAVRRLIERASQPERLSSDQRARIARRLRELNDL